MIPTSQLVRNHRKNASERSVPRRRAALFARDVEAVEREELAQAGACGVAEPGVIPVAAPRARFRREARGGFGYSPYNERATRLDDDAMRVLQLIDGERSIINLAEAIAPGDSTGPSRAEAALASLISAHLVRWSKIRRPGRAVNIEDHRPPVPSSIERLSAPLVVHWEPTLKCNLVCTTCYNSSGPDGPDGVASDIVIPQLLASGTFLTTILGGEPLVERQFVDNVLALEAGGMGVEFVTNGWLLTEEYLKRIEGTRICELMVSVDGPEEMHDRIRGRQSSFRRAIEGVRRFSDAGYDVTVSLTVLRSNLNDLEAMIDLCADAGASYLKLRPIVNSGRAQDEVDQSEAVSPADVLGYQPLLRRKLEEFGGALRFVHTAPVNVVGGCFCPNDPSDKAFRTCGGGPCFVGRTLAYVRQDGGVAPHAFVREHVVGNITSEPLKTIWQDDARWAAACP
ncbi:radical SAM protein [Sorangium sp. KYC3313]|uniref:radical SAM protein n=1 Tax=Sorangium sp. KYC3313 TaxID=3449740 RepID=UPI003F89E82E